MRNSTCSWLSVICAMVLGHPVLAQQAAPANQPPTSSAAGFEEVIVTARRVEETAQKVPISVDVLSPIELQRVDMRDLSDLTMNLPGLGTCCGRGFSTLNSLRGVAGVNNYFDDVPVQLFGGRGYTFDIDSLQVLKGPQGTLFGVATNGGAILENPRRPADDFSGYAEVTVGTYGHEIVEGVLNTPIIKDILNLRTSFVQGHTDPIGKRIDTQEKIGDEDYWAGRLSADYHKDDLENYTVFNYYSSNETEFQAVMQSYDPNGPSARLYGAATFAALLKEQQAIGPYAIPGLPTTYTPRVIQEIVDVINKTTYDLSDKLQIKNTFGWESYASSGTGLEFGIPLGVNYQDPRTQPPRPQYQWTEELQLIASKLWDRLDLQIGTFNMGQFNDGQPLQYTGSFGTVNATSTTSTDRTHAVYGQGTYDVSEILDGLSFTVGYRYTWDALINSSSRYTVSNLAVNQYLRGQAQFASGSYTLGLQYQITPDIMVYFTNSKGFSRGGFTLTALPPANVYGPERLTNYEIGIKSIFDIGDVKTRLNISAYTGDYIGKQVLQSFLSQVLPPPAPLTLLTVTSNVGTAYPYGVDADIDFLLPYGLEAGGTLAYIHAYYADFPTLNGVGQPINKSGLIFVAVPAWSFTLHGGYNLPIDAKYGSVSASLDYSFVGKEMRDTAATIPDPVYYHGYMPSISKLNASIVWKDVYGHDGLSATVYGTNLMGLTLEDGGTCTWTSLGLCSPSPAQPRMVGLRVRQEF